MLEDGDPKFKRVPIYEKIEKVPNFNGTWSQFNMRLNRNYNPGHTERRDKWDIEKKEM